ncbi:unnamed protein product [Camellia sinensis]
MPWSFAWKKICQNYLQTQKIVRCNSIFAYFSENINLTGSPSFHFLAYISILHSTVTTSNSMMSGLGFKVMQPLTKAMITQKEL